MRLLRTMLAVTFHLVGFVSLTGAAPPQATQGPAKGKATGPAKAAPAPTKAAPVAPPPPLFAIVQSGKWGFMDRTGKVVVPPQFDEPSFFFHSELAQVKIGEKYGLIDRTGKLVSPIEFLEVSCNLEVCAAVKVKKGDGEAWGFVGRDGKLVGPAIFDEIYPVSKGLSVMAQNGKYGFADGNGRIVVPAKYDEVQTGTDSDFPGVRIGEKWGMVDPRGKVVIPVEYDSIIYGGFSEGMARVKSGGKWGFYSNLGRLAIPAKYDAVLEFSQGLAAVRIGNKWGFIDKTGAMAIPAEYESALWFGEGLVAVMIGGKMGYIDKTKKVIIPPTFDRAGKFCKGFTSVETGGKTGTIDKTGKFIIPAAYDYMHYDCDTVLEDGAVVAVGKLYGIVDAATGKVRTQPRFNNMEGGYTDGLLGVQYGDKWGFIDKTGAMVIAPQFDGGSTFEGGLASVTLDGKMAYIDTKGRVVWKEE